MNYSNQCGGTSTQYSNAVGLDRGPFLGGGPTNPPRPSTGQMTGGSCSVTVTHSGNTSTCHGTLTKRGVCKPCNKMAGVGRSAQAATGMSNFVGGQKLWFNQSGTQTTVDAGMSVSQYVMGLIGVGVLFFVVGYGYKKGVEKA